MSVDFFRHPSAKRLRAWLDADSSASTATNDGTTDTVSDSDVERRHARIEVHVEQCERCAARLEELVHAPGAPDDESLPGIGDALRDIYRAPDDIELRVLETIDARKRSERELNLLVGLFGIVGDAADLLLTNDIEQRDAGGHDARLDGDDTRTTRSESQD